MGEDGKIVYKIVLEDGDVVTQAESSGRKAGGAFEQIMVGAARRIGEAFVNMAARAGEAVVNMTKAAVDSVAALEQNVGGIETLFKESSATVIANAERAYKTAGLSANEYMETVTSISASLLQSLNNDTAQAAAYADRAIIDMSDNANKMGTDMAAIQNAYQGFAKQNYTMLDNLKLGYGGTKGEMERLLRDAERLDENFKLVHNTAKNGADEIEYSYADIVQAIHIVQTEMGITGTTAQEASDTIAGSMASAKAAYDNFLNGSGSAQELAEAVAIAAQNVGKNLTEIVGRLAVQLPQLITSLAPKIPAIIAPVWEAIKSAVVGVISALVQLFVDGFPGMVDAGLSLISGLLFGFGEALPQIIETVTVLLLALVAGFLDHLPEIVEAGISIISGLIDGILAAIPLIIEALPTVITALLDGLLLSIEKMQEAGDSILHAILDGILSAIPELLSMLPQIINTLLDFFTKNLPTIMTTGVHILMSIINGIIDAIPDLVRMLPQIILAIQRTIVNNLPTIIEAGVSVLTAIIEGIIGAIPALVAALPEVIGTIFEIFANTPWVDVGINIVTGIWDGIKSLWGSVVDAVTQMAQELWGSVKSFFGIASPSKKFRWIGEMNMEGMIEGFEDEEASLIRTVTDVYSAVPDAAQSALQIPAPAFSASALEQAVSFNMTATGAASDMTIVVPVMLNDREIARATAWSMGEQLAWEEI